MTTSTPPTRLRVLFVIGSMHAGGAERQVVEMLRHLDRERFEPYLYLAHRDGALLAEVPSDVPVEAFWGGTRPHSFGLKLLTVCRGGIFARMWHLSQFLKRLRPDVVYDRTYLSTLDTAGACWWRDIPRVSAAVADPRIQFEMYAKRLRFARRKYARWAYHTAAKVLANSSGLRQQMIDYWGLPSEHVMIQPNGLDFDRIEQRMRENVVLGADDLVRILTVGRIDEDKGHIDLLTALEDLVHRRGHTELRWQILGVGPRMETLRQEIAAKKLTEHVELLGAVSNPFPYYAAVDVFCLPSRSEGLPNVLLEALACGLPVISTDCPSGPREILEGGRYGRLVPVRDSAAIVSAIEDFLDQREEWKRTAIAGRASVQERFDVRRVVKQLEAILEAAARTK
ncbi:MAG: glycosyltransferase [Planctomycetaceae bacterium]|nr:glycosyltransferase [Planctomycetaceae bacterium]